MNRSESLLGQFLQTIGSNLPINVKVVFINPEFILYQTPLNKPFILPTQINSYLKKLNLNSSNLNEKHRWLADKIIFHHIEDSPIKLLPSYKYEQLQKGITCDNCTSISVFINGKICICQECRYEESVETAVMRNVKEFKLLFPEKKVTTLLRFTYVILDFISSKTTFFSCPSSIGDFICCMNELSPLLLLDLGLHQPHERPPVNLSQALI